MGILLHYDGSASDAGAVQWLTKDPRCNVSYNWLILDSGSLVVIAPEDARAWHAGVCRSSDRRLPYTDANSAFYGITLAARPGEVVTQAAKATLLDLCRRLFAKHHWPVSESFRIVGHASEAWPRGRKVDPEGPDPARPVLSTIEMRCLVGLESSV